MSPAPPSSPSSAVRARRATTAAERDLLRRLAAGTAGVVGAAFLRALTHHLAAAFAADVAFVGEHLDGPERRVRVVASWQCAELPEGYEFTINEQMPCAVVVREGLLAMPRGAVAAYPGDQLVAAHGLDAYLGVGLPGADGSQIGYLALMSSRPLTPDDDEIAVLRIFGARAAAEIERGRHQSALRARDAEVAAARSRVLDAADGERRRIGRDLHDGAQQRVVALGHLIGLARRRLGDDAPAGAVELLDRAQDEARQATGELRELARGLHPAGLTENGLGPTLEALAARSALPLHVDALPERRLPAPIELTAYYLTSEALTNALRHAQATAVHVAVRLRLDTVTVTVTDDGVGGADPQAGSGLSGLADRVGALGGELTVASAPGAGTRLVATIPLAPWRSARDPFLEFGAPDDDGRGERNIQAVLAGRKTVSVTLAREWELEGGVPRVGQRLPVMDHEGRRRATVEVTGVASLPFVDIDEQWLTPEEVDAPSLEAWRMLQRRFYDRCRDELALLFVEPGWRFTDEEPMVLLWYRAVPD